jgi:hypothetical protein
MKPHPSYLQTINTSFMILLTAHLPVACGVALYFGASVSLAAVLSLLFLAGPALLIIQIAALSSLPYRSVSPPCVSAPC